MYMVALAVITPPQTQDLQVDLLDPNLSPIPGNVLPADVNLIKVNNTSGMDFSISNFEGVQILGVLPSNGTSEIPVLVSRGLPIWVAPLSGDMEQGSLVLMFYKGKHG